MTRTRGQPRRPSRDAGAGQGTERVPSGSGQLNRSNQSAVYSPFAAQQATSTPGPGMVHYPLTSTAPYPPTSHASAPPPLFQQPHPQPFDDLPMDDDDDEDEDDDHTHLSTNPPPATSSSSSDLIGDETATLAEYPYSIYNHGTWTAEDDKTLIQARARGQNWADLQRAHFPAKTANACRKRYERLVERRGIYDYSGRRLEMVANEYMNLRREMWSGLADRVGMKWEVVEALCMGVGLRAIQSNARSYTNRARRDTRISQKTREAQADVVPVGPAGLPPLAPMPPPPAPAGLGALFPGHLDRDASGGGRNDVGLMPPPPFIPISSSLPSGRLPPITLSPQEPFGGYNSHPGSSSGSLPLFATSSRRLDWDAANLRGPV